jgi:hypothetical protein
VENQEKSRKIEEKQQRTTWNVIKETQDYKSVFPSSKRRKSHFHVNVWSVPKNKLLIKLAIDRQSERGGGGKIDELRETRNINSVCII